MKAKQKRNAIKRRNDLWGYLFVSPSAILVTVFILIPIIMSIVLSLTEFTGFAAPTFNGLQNYIRAFNDRKFKASMGNALIYVFTTVPLQTALSLIIAAILADKFRNPFGETIRGTMFIPVLSSAVIAGNLFYYLFASDAEGFVNTMLSLVGLERVNWLGQSKTAMTILCVVGIWKNVGYFMVIFYAAIMDVPATLHEAARMDGASPIQRFFHIVIPGIKPVLYLVITLGTIWSFQFFEIAKVMTKGGPGLATTSPVLLIYTDAFSEHRMGYATALACLLAVVILFISLVQRYAMKEDD